MDPLLDAYWSLKVLCHTSISFLGAGFHQPSYRHKRAEEDTTSRASPSPTNLSLRKKRALFTVAMIVVTLISTFTAGSAVGFAVQGQVAKYQGNRLEQQIDEVETLVDALEENVQPMSFLNSGLLPHGTGQRWEGDSWGGR